VKFRQVVLVIMLGNSKDLLRGRNVKVSGNFNIGNINGEVFNQFFNFSEPNESAAHVSIRLMVALVKYAGLLYPS